MVNITYCDFCGKETGYNEVTLIMREPRTGHGVNIKWDLCSKCGKAIEGLIRAHKLEVEREVSKA